ncbi:hypothetical protein BS78_07G111700 [Paspalum vaginatum]|nr:hypothetical protein BS78_07G111700 [Paspalum vaginatum]
MSARKSRALHISCGTDTLLLRGAPVLALFVSCAWSRGSFTAAQNHHRPPPANKPWKERPAASNKWGDWDHVWHFFRCSMHVQSK